MTSTIPQHSAASVEHFTPPHVIEAARATLGGTIDLDPASCAKANELVRARAFFSEATNGFTQEWFGRVFLNPPGGRCDPEGLCVRRREKSAGGGFVYGNGEVVTKPTQSASRAWWFKLAREWVEGRVDAAIFLGFSIEIVQTAQVKPPVVDGEPLPGPLDFPLCYPARRLDFIAGEGENKTGNTHASVIAFLPPSRGRGAALDLFRAVFSPIGRVVG